MKKILYLSPRYDLKKTYVNESIYQNFNSNKYVLVPLPFIFDKNSLSFLLKNSAGLLLLGGIDLNPNLYNQENQGSEYIDLLDKYDFLLLDICLENKIKVLGICRGLQVINVYFKGTLLQNITNHYKTSHIIHFIKNCLFYKQDIVVNSFHHQAISTLGNNLEIIAVSDDNIIEGIYCKKYNILAFQFHPEFDNNFTTLVENFFD